MLVCFHSSLSGYDVRCDTTAKASQFEEGAQHPRSRKVCHSHPHLLSAFIVLLSHANCFQRRKALTKPRDESTPSGRTAAESVRNLLKKNAKYSKRINYDALKNLFVGGGNQNIDLDEKDDLYSIDDKMEDGIIVEEGGGGVGNQKPPWTASRDGLPNTTHEREEESDKGDDEDPYVGWDEVYEQEV